MNELKKRICYYCRATEIAGNNYTRTYRRENKKTKTPTLSEHINKAVCVCVSSI